jgi:hypothetical protein
LITPYVRQQRITAAKREPVPDRRTQRDSGDLAVQRADRHQAGAA